MFLALSILADVAYFVVVALHVYFVVLEMALWKRLAPKIFHVSPEFAGQSAGLASNQGVYNGFLVLAMLIGYFAPGTVGFCFMMYGIICAIVAGIWGGITVSRKIVYVQAAPAVIAFLLQFSILHMGMD